MQECVVEKKTLERHERNLAMRESEQCVVEKKRWDSFIGLAKISKKREDILDDALRLELQLHKEVEDAEIINDPAQPSAQAPIKRHLCSHKALKPS